MFQSDLGRDGFTRDFGRGRDENLSDVISWFTFFAAEQLTSGEAKAIGGGNCAEIGDSFSVEAEELSLFAQSAGSRGVRRINVWAESCGGLRPLMMAVVMSGASQGRRRRV